MGPMMPPPPGMRGPMRIGGGPRGFLTDEEKQNKPKLTKALLKRRQRRCKNPFGACGAGVYCAFRRADYKRA